MTLSWLDEQDPDWFPPTYTALAEPNGLLAAGGDLSPRRLVGAYRRGIFPWFEVDQPILWWSPNPRFVLTPSKLKVSRSLAKRVRQERFEIRFDTTFTDVMRACAAPRPNQSDTWITTGMYAAYTRLHELGIAHSAESWKDGQLVGGLYGLALGRVFFGESMFHRTTDASKVAFVELCRRLEHAGFELIDCQVETPHLASLGALHIDRDEFESRVATLVDTEPSRDPWTA